MKVKIKDGEIEYREIMMELYYINGWIGNFLYFEDNLFEVWLWEYVVIDLDWYIDYEFFGWWD